MTKIKNIPEVELFSDGGANPNPGKGGYGIILSCRGVKKEFSQGYTLTTNNRMELTGVITGLSKLKTRSKVQVYTDSQYTINGIEKGWAEKWKANNWYRTKVEKATNFDLWEILIDLIPKHEVKFTWVKGHNGHIENERCDELATLAMESDNLIEDKNYVPNESDQLTLTDTNNKDKIIKTLGKGDKSIKVTKEGDKCRKCLNKVIKKFPKHTQKTLEKKYYYEYFLSCPYCKTNYMIEDGKRDIKNLKI